MRSRMRNHVQPRESVQAREAQVRREIEGFLRAVSSYPKRAAKEPRVSFQKHLCSVFAASEPQPRRRD
jgi:hypothetical protein